jgi:urea carboxylase
MRLLVANRGEIAARILRTARAIGAETVAVFSDADRGSPHVRLGDEAVRLGPAPPRESYLDADRVLAAARESRADALHPGYGLLSEDAGFARAVLAAGIAWIGPTPDQLELFGAKDAARRLARTVGVPLLAGTEILADADGALAAARDIGYPVMLKATGGGGGIGMARCDTPDAVRDGFARVERLAAAAFGRGGVFLERCVERPRHVEVQVFGDGAGQVIVLGDRDCTLQRRHQKVIEEAPAPALSDALRARLWDSARALCSAARYRSAGTVEFVLDAERGEISFLEVNARLQVEHTVTEEVCGIDLVEWMLRLAAGDRSMFTTPAPAPRGCAIQARVYAEDPGRDFAPSAGLLTEVSFPGAVRVDTWVETGTEVTSAYDPLLAKLIAYGEDRPAALARLTEALRLSRIAGIRTNLGLLEAALSDEAFLAATHTTETLAGVEDPAPRIDVVRAGTMTTVQDWPGRRGLWHVGVPPSGPMDDRSFRLGNESLGNAPGAPGLECVLQGPSLRFGVEGEVCVCGAPCEVSLDGMPVPMWEPVRVPAGAVLDVGPLRGPGLRAYVLFAGGLDVPACLGSAATFTLGGFGGHGGRALRQGDVLACGRPSEPLRRPAPVPLAERPTLEDEWAVEVLEGPHADPEFFTEEDIETFYATAWEVHFNSARTGVRLIGPRLRWAREDGGEAGLHPSNIHDTPYAVGAVDFTGDVPILLGPDGPSLGGFVCPATMRSAERWKLGQLRPGDRVRFRRVGRADGGVLGRREGGDDGPCVTYRRSGDDNVLVEYGPMTLDLGLRMRVHVLAERIAQEARAGVIDLTPGIRSLQIHVDPDVLPVARALELARELEDTLPATEELVVPSREVRLPLSWDDPATRLAIQRYMTGVRPDAPWCPWNIEFIRRINGLDSVEEVHRTVFDASYLVLGLGDVYLGAPVATPLDPRHRLVTTKYNPARTWTPENAVGIGGAYLCIYGMEGPGGYQFVGRTVQVWSRYRPMPGGEPWLLRFFDRISWFPVSAEELLEMREDMAAGRLALDIRDGEFAFGEYSAMLSREAGAIAAFRERQQAAFAAEREAWVAAGEFTPSAGPESAANPTVDAHRDEAAADPLPEDAVVLEAPLQASVWQIDVAPGDRVAAGQRLVTLEAMKMETSLESPVDGEVLHVLVGRGDHVIPGAGLVVLRS